MLTWTEKGERLDGEMHNRLGFAVQLAVLRFPGRPLKDLAGVPSRVLAAIADQVQVPASAFARYGDRDNTVYEHLDEIRRTYQFRWHIREETLLAALACLDNFVLFAPLSRSWGTEPPHLLMACACPWG